MALHADFGVLTGSFRPLHGINKGPQVPGGLIDLTAEHRALALPFVRLHDCGWPNPPVVDIHAVFPNAVADPTSPSSYDFRLTDGYLAAIRASGAQMVYRLGESIEHTAVKRYVHPPPDPAKWAEICLGIIRHYNEGWAGGFHHDIRYWEIWNEPENRPSMWSGTDEDYFRLYRTVATAIKQQYPSLRVGGPAVGALGRLIGDKLEPTAFVTDFLSRCRRDAVPLDFFSWHCYTADVTELTRRGWAVRRLLDATGFNATESHLNEWNYLPGNSWSPLSPGARAGDRRRFYAEMSGPAGAAFVVSALLELQEAPVDMGNLFHGELGGFGLFDEYGAPLPVYRGLQAFRSLIGTSRRVMARGGVPGQIAFAAGRGGADRTLTLLLSTGRVSGSDFNLTWANVPWDGGSIAEIQILDGGHDFSHLQTVTNLAHTPGLRLSMSGPGVALVRLRPERSNGESPALVITSPAYRLVYQRNLQGRGVLPVAGTCAWPGARVETRLLKVSESGRVLSPEAGAEEDAPWRFLVVAGADGQYRGRLEVPGGWYRLEVRAQPPQGAGAPPPAVPSAMAMAVVDRVGVGEVFVVVGHSVAQGGEIDLPGAVDDRVNTIALSSGNRGVRREYERTGEVRFLPELQGTQFGDRVPPAPFGHGPYFWAAFADRIARAQGVPVLLLNAAFGGTTLEHWARSARGESFEHSFVKSGLRMPYLNLQHALKHYGTVTGVRAVLADHGQNDAGEPSEDRLVANYRAWVEQARRDLAFPQLAVVVNRQTPAGRPAATSPVRRAQERMVGDVPFCYAGPDYDRLLPTDRSDGIHLSEAGLLKAAALWAEALDSGFFRSVVPYQP